MWVEKVVRSGDGALQNMYVLSLQTHESEIMSWFSQIEISNNILNCLLHCAKLPSTICVKTKSFPQDVP